MPRPLVMPLLGDAFETMDRARSLAGRHILELCAENTDKARVTRELRQALDAIESAANIMQEALDEYEQEAGLVNPATGRRWDDPPVERLPIRGRG